MESYPSLNFQLGDTVDLLREIAMTHSQKPVVVIGHGAEQVRDFTKLFTYESDKLEFAKFAYDYCYDKGK